MTTTLKATLLDSDRRPAVVADLQALVDQEVAGKSGLSGGIVKTGYAAVKKVKADLVESAIDRMLDEFVDALEQYWAFYQTQPAADFGVYLAERPEEVSNALLGVTDRRAERSSREAVKSVYAKLRPKAQENVMEALPGLGRTLEKHAA